jgi:hypothetical protein
MSISNVWSCCYDLVNLIIRKDWLQTRNSSSVWHLFGLLLVYIHHEQTVTLNQWISVLLYILKRKCLLSDKPEHMNVVKAPDFVLTSYHLHVVYIRVWSEISGALKDPKKHKVRSLHLYIYTVTTYRLSVLFTWWKEQHLLIFWVLAWPRAPAPAAERGDIRSVLLMCCACSD